MNMPLKPYIEMDEVTVHFPMHLDGSNRSFRSMLTNMMRPGSEKRRYFHGLHRVDFKAEVNDKIGIVGRNGAGKTTLLRTIGGIYEPDRGTITRYGKTIPLINLSMGMDHYATGIENVALRGALYGMNAEEIEQTIEDVREFSELGPFLNEPIRTYSSGMLARLSFGIATSVNADIILMDEWISAGDMRFIDRAEARMERLLGDGRIVLLASHSAALVRKWCNRLLVMEGGEIVYDGRDVQAGLDHLNKLMETPAKTASP